MVVLASASIDGAQSDRYTAHDDRKQRMWTRRECETPVPQLADGFQERTWHFGKGVTRSPIMGEAFQLLERFAWTDVTLTLLGETGAGKDVLAHALHEKSTRASGPFVVFDCG